MIAILHNIRSLYNVGSIFRTADAVGLEKIYLCGITPTPYDEFGQLRPQLAKVSLGAEKTVSWEKVKQTTRLIDVLKKSDFEIFVVEIAKNSIPYNEIEKIDPKKIALVFGHEVKGISPAILKKADKILSIPMRGKKESLNVAVAFGIVAYHLSLPRITGFS